MKKVSLLKLFFVSLLSFSGTLFAQCISSFPNTETFESGPVWMSGGTNSDWAWGSPSKAVISSAGGGAKCWVIGGLNGSSYAGGQQSYIESPCYNFSTLTYPSVSFKIFWEMEYKYDGGNLQYSTNNGSTWTTIGNYNDPVNCTTQNWINYGTINYLAWSGSKQGWSGNSKPTTGSCQGGGGSMGWVTTRHCLANLAGQSNVKFRFTFGSGTSCNNFDGFAIDDFTIENSVISPSTFTNTCSNFTSINSSCSSPGSYLWNFGDPSTGANNTSTLTNATHVFSNPGMYTVSLTTIGGTCGGNSVFSKTVNVLGTSFSPVNNVTCHGGNNGSATVLPLNGNGGYSYTWTPVNEFTSTAYSLTAGNYSVTVKDALGCSTTNTVTITEPAGSTGAASQTIISCFGDNTLLQVSTTGITDPISFLWTPGNYTTSAINITPSVTTIYTVDVTISGACAKNEQKLFTALVSPKPMVAISSQELMGCAPFCFNVSDRSSTQYGVLAHQEWNFNDGTTSQLTNPVFCFSNPGIYTGNHAVSNSFGCTGMLGAPLTVTVLPSPTAEFIANKYTLTELDPVVQFTDQSSVDAVRREWNFGGLDSSSLANPAYEFKAIGNYPVILTVTNMQGCTNSVMRDIKVLPEFTLFVPDSFSPNGDGLNEVFLPEGMGWKTETYQLWIYNRMGEKVFHCNDYTRGWNGGKNGNADIILSNDTYTWKIELTDITGRARSLAGHVVLLK
ncbi:MAG: hypothetical protein JWO32_3125 [Bacteroidetes bacterium]|nr:hypothetical protein [Bacteroidota bacterium]